MRYPRCRRTKGLATPVRSCAAGIDGHFAIGCLETDRAGFYGRLGWELLRGPLAGRRVDGSLVPTPDQTGVMVLRLTDTPELDLGAMLTIECQSSPSGSNLPHTPETGVTTAGHAIRGYDALVWE